MIIIDATLYPITIVVIYDYLCWFVWQLHHDPFHICSQVQLECDHFVSFCNIVLYCEYVETMVI